MCGIFGYVGKREAPEILLNGLRALEYRGYDSAGVYIPAYGVIKAAGPVSSLAEKISSAVSGTSGIAHTRWATHGPPTELNAHPHSGANGALYIVHNGIIENYRELKAECESAGVRCESETDTEVLAKLIGLLYVDSLEEALRAALPKVRGTYGIAVMHRNEPGTIAIARMGSPIIIGIGSGEYFVSSDASALVSHTKEIIYLQDGDVALITESGHDIKNVRGEIQHKTSETIDWDVAAIQKKGYEHFLLKEIMEIPEAIENTIRGRVDSERGAVKLGGLEPVLAQVQKLDRLSLVGCGSAAYAGLVGKNFLETYAQLPVDVELGSEYRYRNHPIQGKTALLAISQSGETADTLASLRKAKEMGLLTLGIVNVVGSTIARETDAGVYNHAGPEISIASTKAFVSQVVVLLMITLLFGKERGMSAASMKEITKALGTLSDVIRTIFAQRGDIEILAQKYATYANCMYIGRTTHAPIAYEGALKLKEVTYVHAEAYAGGELKHGPIALLDPSFPVIALAPQNDVYEKMISNIEEVRARHAPVLVVATASDEPIKNIADDVILVPRVHDSVQPLVSLIPLQLFAYYVGIAKGINVDRPRNLAKSVTVE